MTPTEKLKLFTAILDFAWQMFVAGCIGYCLAHIRWMRKLQKREIDLWNSLGDCLLSNAKALQGVATRVCKLEEQNGRHAGVSAEAPVHDSH